MFPLRITIPAVTGAVAIAAAGLVAVLFNQQARDIARTGAEASVQTRSLSLARQYETRFRQIARDATLLGTTASVRQVAGLAPVPGTPVPAIVTAPPGTPATLPSAVGLTAAKQATTALFETLLRTSGEYTQARVISIRSGQELLRVDRLPNGTVAAAPEAGLQDKSGESYFRDVAQHDWSDGADMGTDTAADPDRPHALFSQINFNREFGKISFPAVFTQRVMYPLLNPAHQPVAFVVLNFNYSDLLAQVFDRLPPTARAVVTNDQGDYLIVDGQNGAKDFQINGEYTHPPSALVKTILSSEAASGKLTVSDAIGYYTTLALTPAQPHQRIRVGVVETLPDLLGEIGDPSWEGWIAAGLILVMALAAIAILSTIIMRPLGILGRAIDEATTGNSGLRLPLHWRHELGGVARAFQRLLDRHVQAETRLNLILDSIGEGIVTIDSTGRIVNFNPACERMFGYAREQVIGENVSMLMPLRQARSHDKYLSRYMESGERKMDWAGREEMGRRSDGSRFPLELTVSETVIDGKLHFIGILRDISERQKLEQAKSEFLATASHELRTPLTSIHGILKLLGNDAIRDDPEKCARFIGIAAANSERLRRLIVNMTEMMEFEGRIHTIAREPLDLLDLVEASAPYRKELSARSGVRIVVDEGCESVPVLGDRERLELVLENLLSNAVKFSPAGGEVRLGIRRTTDGRLGMVTVEDEGAGVPEENRKKIWDRFTQADSSSRRIAEGAGLGLAVASFLMRLHDGAVHYAPRAKKGSLFWFELPVLSDSAGPEAQDPDEDYEAEAEER